MLHKLLRKHYIQCGLAVVLTSLVLWFTSSLWYQKAIIVSFDAIADKDIEYQVFYTEADGQIFNQKQSVRKTVKKGKSKVEILLPIEKIMKFRLDFGVIPGSVKFKNLQISGQKSIKICEITDLRLNQIDKITKENDFFQITSNQGDPYIIYIKNLHLNLSASFLIDWCKLVIISVLAFLFSYKFVQYLSKFKLEKQHSRIDIVMLTAFFGLLFVPMSHISDAVKSEQENRMLAPKPQLSVAEGVDNYGAQFDAWYNDHFFGRSKILEFYTYLKYLLAPKSGNNKVLVGKNGWLFYKLDNSMDKYANIYNIQKSILQNSLNYLSLFNDWCEKHNKKLYVFIAPDKNKIYGENYRLVKQQRSDDYSVGHQIYNYISKNSDVKVIYPYDALIKNKGKDYLYYKQDTHWNDLGAYIGYKELMKTMNIKPIKVMWEDQKHSGDLHKMFPVFEDDASYSSYIFDIKKYCHTANSSTYDKYCEYKKNGKRAFVMSDSFFVALSPYLIQHFNKVYFRNKKYFLTEKDFEFIKDNVDIVIIETVERGVERLNQKFPL